MGKPTISTGWWFEPLWKIFANWDDDSQYMGKKMFQTTNQFYDMALFNRYVANYRYGGSPSFFKRSHGEKLVQRDVTGVVMVQELLGVVDMPIFFSKDNYNG